MFISNRKQRVTVSASLAVESRCLRCDRCKADVPDELATECPACAAVFDSIVSDDAGMAAKLKRRREAAGVYACR